MHSWHDRVTAFYNKNGYVETLTGRRRRGPLNNNQVINTPIQGTAADLTTDAMNRISLLAEERELPWLQPRLQIHDDLTFWVPRKKVDDCIEIVSKEMVRSTFDFVNVPTIVEMEVGKDWYHMESVGSFKGEPARV